MNDDEAFLRFEDVIERLDDGTCRTADGIEFVISDGLWAHWSQHREGHLLIRKTDDRWIHAELYRVMRCSPPTPRRIMQTHPSFQLELQTGGKKVGIRVKKAHPTQEGELGLAIFGTDVLRWLNRSDIVCPSHGTEAKIHMERGRGLNLNFVGCCSRINKPIEGALAEYLEEVRRQKELTDSKAES